MTQLEDVVVWYSYPKNHPWGGEFGFDPVAKPDWKDVQVTRNTTGDMTSPYCEGEVEVVGLSTLHEAEAYGQAIVDFADVYSLISVKEIDEELSVVLIAHDEPRGNLLTYTDRRGT